MSQQLVIAAISVAQTPDIAEGCPLVSHWKLEAGSLERQSVAAVTRVLHQLTSALLSSHPATHAVLVLGQAVVSVAHRIAQSSGPVVVVVELVVEWVVVDVEVEPPVLEPAGAPPEEQAASGATAATHSRSQGTTPA